jgi:hypothetical protein
LIPERREERLSSCLRYDPSRRIDLFNSGCQGREIYSLDNRWVRDAYEDTESDV